MGLQRDDYGGRTFARTPVYRCERRWQGQGRRVKSSGPEVAIGALKVCAVNESTGLPGPSCLAAIELIKFRFSFKK